MMAPPFRLALAIAAGAGLWSSAAESMAGMRPPSASRLEASPARLAVDFVAASAVLSPRRSGKLPLTVRDAGCSAAQEYIDTSAEKWLQPYWGWLPVLA